MSKQQDDFRIIPGQLSPAPTQGCPNEEVWFEVAGGLVDLQTEGKLLEHAATCGSCGPMLREARLILKDEETAEESALLDSGAPIKPPVPKMLPTSRQAAWQKWVLIPAAAALVLVAIWLTGRPDPTKLVASAYSSWRTIEFRMPAAAHAAHAPVRLSGEGNSTSRPVEVQEALAAVARHLKETPGDPNWLLAEARLQLLLGESATATRSLERLLLRLEPGPLQTAVRLELAAAHFEEGRRLSRSEPLGRAFDLLSEILKEQPSNPIALFNRAVAAEALEMPRQAIDDWEAFLRVESTGGWASEARERLKAVRAKVAMIVPPPQDPAGFLALHANGGLLAAPERFVEIASFQWLPRLRQSEEARKAATLLADQLVQRHGDPWLRDALAHPSAGSESFEKAAALLAESAAKTALGDGERAVALGRQAVAAFERTGSAAAVLRARTQFVYAMSRSLKSPELVVREALRLEPELARRGFIWCQIQTMLERGATYQGQYDKALAKGVIGEASRLAGTNGYRNLGLRAAGFSAQAEGVFGSYDQAWSKQASLLAARSEWAPMPIRTHQLTSDISRMVEHLGLPNTAYAYAREAAQTPGLESNRRTLAFGLLRQGTTAAKAGYSAEAASSVARAEEILGSIGAPSVQTALIDARTYLADLDLREGHYAKALAGLRPFQEKLPPPRWFRVRYLNALGFALSGVGESAEASKHLRASIAEVRKGLSSIVTESERVQLLNEEAGAYRALVAQSLDAGNPEAALSIWQEYRAAGASNPSRFSPGAGIVALVFVELRSRLGAFVVTDDSVKFRWVADDVASLRRQARRFADVCADPASPLTDVQRASRPLFNSLVAPFWPQLKHATTIVVEPDDALVAVPFHALQHESASYLGQTHRVAYSFGFASWRELRKRAGARSSSEATLVAWSPVAAGQPHTNLADALELRQRLTATRHATVLNGEEVTVTELGRRLLSTDRFYFVGHGLNHGDSGGLALARNDVLDADAIRGLHLARAPVVFLAACSTASGQSVAPANADSLVRAFQAAGASTVIASRWNVDLLTVAQLASEFDAASLAGLAPVEALHRAAAIVRERSPHPYHWASISLFGADQPTF